VAEEAEVTQRGDRAVTASVAEDVERLLDWKLQYILAHPKTRQWLSDLRKATPESLPHVVKAVLLDSDVSPEAIAFRCALMKIAEARARTGAEAHL
jgi:hypothetical protein